MADDCKGEYIYETCLPARSCSYIMRIPQNRRCEFVHTVEDCRDDDAIFWYMHYIACRLNDAGGEMYMGLVLAVALGVAYFMFLSYASDFFTPSLCYISNALGLSESFAGATLLALGNSAPDIFTSLVGAMKIGFQQIVSQVIGSGMFLTTIVVAVIALIEPFRVSPVTFLRSLLTYMLALALLFGAYITGQVNIGLAIAFFLLYVIYIAMFIVKGVREGREKIQELVEQVVEEEDRSKHVRMVRKDSLTTDDYTYMRESHQLSIDGWVKKPMERDLLNLKRRETTPILNRQRLTWAPHVLQELSNKGVEFPTRMVSRDSKGTALHGTANATLEVERGELLREFGQRERARRSTMLNANVVLVEIWGQPMVVKHHTLVKDFFLHMSPIDVDEWQEMSLCCRALSAVLAPMVLLCKFLIPCVDESIVCNNWCKLLFVMQCVYLPPILACSMGVMKLLPFEVYMPVLVSVTLAGLMIAAWVAQSSEVNEAPPYHMAVAVFGFLVSIIFIYVAACEVLSILIVIGQLLSISTATLALTLVAWGNGVGDFVNSVSLAKAGFPRMAFTGIYGSNVLMVLVGVGIFFLLVLTKTSEGVRAVSLKRENPELVSDAFVLLMVVCVASLMIVPTYDFRLRRSFSFFLLVMYVLFIPYCVLSEFALINSFALPYHFIT